MYHSDCNEDFELIKGKLPYIVDDEELEIINKFLFDNQQPIYCRPSYNSVKQQLEDFKNNKYSGDYGFGKLKQLIFNIPGQIPTLVDKGKGEIGFTFEEITKYSVPSPIF